MSARAACRLERLGFGDAYDYVAGKLAWLAAGHPWEGQIDPATRAAAVARTDVPTCSLDDTVGEVGPRLDGWEVCVVVHDNVVLGAVDREALDSHPATPVEQVMAPGPTTFRPSVSREELVQHLESREHDHALLTTYDGQLIGLVRRADL